MVLQLVDTESPRTLAARQLLLRMFDAAVTRVGGRRCVADFLRNAPQSVGQHRKLAVAAIGKAASSMALGVADVCRERMQHLLVITKDGHCEAELLELARDSVHFEVLESSHPVPDARSLAAGERLLHWLAQLPAEALPLFLISGGASSLVEHLHPGVGLSELMALNRAGLASGWSIERLNRARAQLSAIKGGALAAHIRQPAIALFISDVPGDDPAVIGSGLLGPAGGDRDFDDCVERHVIARLEDALQAAADTAAAAGWRVQLDEERYAGDVGALATRFAAELQHGPPRALVWGGESVVSLPARPGRGGRNQHLALALAQVLCGDEQTFVLAAGTDGTDGVTDDAGAFVTGTTWLEIDRTGYDAELALASADAGTVLEIVGALVHTGPTGTNVGDLLLGLRYDPTP